MNNDKLVNFPKNLIIENANAKQFEIGQPEPESYSCMDNEQINQTEQDNQSEDSTESILNNQVFSLRLDDFDGPIDLLLHLVKRSELPIEKLSLARVADQFLQGFEREIRVYCLGAVAGEQRKVVGFPCRAGFNDEAAASCG